jgi:hypothetical protein
MYVPSNSSGFVRRLPVYRGPYRLVPVPRLSGVHVSGRRWGLGAPGDNATLARQSGSLASAGLMISAAAVGGPAGLMIGAAAAAVVALTQLFINVFSGCGATCVEATRVVDQVEAQYLKPNLANYFAQPVRTQSMQAAALKVFDYAWSMVLQGCSNPALGDAGRRCISERSRSGTVPGTGGNWFIWYRDPIANDSGVVPDSAVAGSAPAPGASVGSAVLSIVGLDPSTTVAGVPVSDLILPAALIAAGFLL